MHTRVFFPILLLREVTTFCFCFYINPALFNLRVFDDCCWEKRCYINLYKTVEHTLMYSGCLPDRPCQSQLEMSITATCQASSRLITGGAAAARATARATLVNITNTCSRTFRGYCGTYLFRKHDASVFEHYNSTCILRRGVLLIFLISYEHTFEEANNFTTYVSILHSFNKVKKNCFPL